MMMSDSICAAVTQASPLDYYMCVFVFSSEGNSRTLHSYRLSVVSTLGLLSGYLMCFALSRRKGKEMRLLC